MRHRRPIPLLTLFLVLSAVVLGHGAATPAFGANCGDCNQGGPCSCGDTVVCDTTLDARDPVLSTVCSSDGLIVKNGVSLHLTGTLRGARQGCGVRIKEPIDFSGGVTVTTGRIEGFETGICGSDTSHNTFSRLEIRRPVGTCIAIVGDESAHNFITQVVCEGAGGCGIVVFVGGGTLIERVRSEGNGGSGFCLGNDSGEGSGALRRSSSLRNQGHGLREWVGE